MIPQHQTPLRLFVASVWLILLTFYMFLYNIDPSLQIFSQGFMLFFTAAGLGLFGLTYWLLKSATPAPQQQRPMTPVEKILKK